MTAASINNASPKHISNAIWAEKLVTVFTDVDGTVLYQNHVPESFIEAYNELTEKQLANVFLATGRNYRSLNEVLRHCSIQLKMFPGVYIDGLVVFGKDENDIISEINLDTDDANQLINETKNLFPDVTITFGTREGMFVTEVNDVITAFAERWNERVIVFKDLNDCVQQTGLQLTHLNYHGNCDLLDLVQRWYHQSKGSKYKLERSTPCCLHVKSGNTSKWLGILKLVEHLKLDPREIVVIGDGSNDIEMLQNCNASVAMGNGCELAKCAARWITDDIRDDGWAKAILSAVTPTLCLANKPDTESTCDETTNILV
eukprot:Gregarina_sp_Poly_1__2242@NODE_159_length_12283_cov_147_306729_g141_i0_p5_GENE_NODE_159_length_12283_cov_147_306729_g141_i0NODE_159_length_12283_cov_147_306729_g141_i0_p5_ORF_typecomplete_len316_score34_57Hydrolase_3/PF08282_12/1_7e43S6PP/PF05116_13/1_6e02S6PP/PF05116_13/4_6e07HAD_2/PF13419_6/6_5HAD_2/PF13419_6/0_014HAD/PF12710_7/40HAD/PF12710_7/0_011Trehalose_PPase/PF02358_16/2_2Trehalose_PPase/PF02358_16/0_13Hydrolase/PF00702_26/0_014Lipase_GDSL_2/PF13472_6/9_4Lipase_GDSL_2/PF13472_6/5_3_NODE_